MNNFGKVLKMYRASKDISQTDMASMLGITTNFLSQVENGKKEMSLTRIEEVAKALGTSKDFLTVISCEPPRELSEKQKDTFKEMQNALLMGFIS